MAIRIPRFLTPRTLQQRNLIFMILPTLVVLLVMGFGSMMTVRNALISQWEQTAIAKMQAGAHEIDMRLARPKRLLMLFQQQAGERRNRQVTQFLLEGIKQLDGVVDVRLTWEENEVSLESDMEHERMRPGMSSGQPLQRIHQLEVTTPEYDSAIDGRTISLVSEYRDEEDTPIGHIEVKISFFDLVDSIVSAAWWQNNRAFLVDQQGNILTRTNAYTEGQLLVAGETFGTASKLERETLDLLQKKPSGTVFGEGLPPDEVSGFYRLKEAPWTVVVISPGKDALAELLGFRKYYFITLIAGSIVVLLLIRSASCSTADAIGRISVAAGELARGNFSPPIREDRRDEVGELTRTFNVMTTQLRERLQLQQAMTIAREVQQNLLPQSSFVAQGIDIHGCSIYCDETGGDYFDLLVDGQNEGELQVVVGDVVGHGIGAALLMASIRAIVRCRTALPGSPVEVMRDVNSILCRDTEQSGSFVSLFYLVIDREEKQLNWVRCGHDPAIVYDCNTETFSELGGQGLVLGFDHDWQFFQQSLPYRGRDLLVLMGTDGVWETENERGEAFGKERVRNLMAQQRNQSAERITDSITETIREFRGTKMQDDDITLVVIKLSAADKV